MARMTGATWRPISINHTKGGQTSVRGVVVHIMAGTLAGTDSWFRNPAARASSHFGTGKGGSLYQWVDTKDRAWAQANGNSAWLSTENEGRGGDVLTAAQLDRNAEILAWAHKTHGVPLKLASGPSDSGLGWHGMGGSGWGGHTQCPGSKIVAQLPEILKRAKVLAGEKPPDPSGSTYKVVSGDTLSAIGKKTGVKWQMIATLNGLEAPYRITPGQELKLKAGAKPAPKPVALAPFPGAGFFKVGRRSPLITAMGKRLVAEGCAVYKSGPGPAWSEADRLSYAKFQRKLGYSGAAADGIPGATSWAKLKVPKA